MAIEEYRIKHILSVLDRRNSTSAFASTRDSMIRLVLL